jgi:hypothetical protein
MHHALLVRGFERICHLSGIFECGRKRQGSLERLALDQLHHQGAFLDP